MTDPVTAHDLAEALRESIHAHRLAFGIFLDRKDETSKVNRWQSLLDRYDAQQRDYLE